MLNNFRGAKTELVFLSVHLTEVSSQSEKFVVLKSTEKIMKEGGLLLWGSIDDDHE